MRSCFFLGSFLLLQTAFAQTPLGRERAQSLLFRGGDFGLTLTPAYSPRAAVRHLSGPYSIGATARPGGEAGFDYRYHLGPQWSLQVGLRGGVSLRNYTVMIPKEELGAGAESDLEENGQLSTSADLYLALPLYVERRWLRPGGSHWNVLGGINLRHALTQWYESSGQYHQFNGQTREAVSVDLEVGLGAPLWVDYNFGGGYTWMLRNYNLLRVNLLANISGTSIAEGTWRIDIPGRPVSTGTYQSRHSFLGISVRYGLTGISGRLRRQYERELEGKGKPSL